MKRSTVLIALGFLAGGCSKEPPPTPAVPRPARDTVSRPAERFPGLSDAPVRLFNPEMTTLIRRWRSDDLTVRDSASNEILQCWETWNSADLDQLDALARDWDSEVAGRARAAKARIVVRRMLGPTVFEKVPRSEEAFLVGGPEERLRVLREAKALWEAGGLKDREIARLKERVRDEDWGSDEALMDALEGVSASVPVKSRRSGGKNKWLEALTSRDVDSVASLLTGAEWGVQPNAYQLMGRLDALETAGSMLPFLKNPHWRVRSRAVGMLVDRDSREMSKHVAPLLKDPDPRARAEAAAALGTFGAKEFVADLVPLLKDRGAEVRRNAAFALGGLGARKHADAIARLLDDPDPWVRMSAAQALGHLGARGHDGGILRLLRESDAEVRATAVWVLGRIAARDAPRRVLPLLVDEDSAVRHAAVWALERLEAGEHAAKVERMLEDPSAWVRSRAARALARFGRRERLGAMLEDADRRTRTYVALALGKESVPRLRELERNPDRVLGLAASISLIRLGALNVDAQRKRLREFLADGVSRALIAGEMLDALASEHGGVALDRLERPLELDGPIESWEDLRGVLAGSGLKLDVRVASRPSRFEGGRPTSIRKALTWLLGGHRAEAHVVATAKTVRIMSRREALEYWRETLEGL